MLDGYVLWVFVQSGMILIMIFYKFGLKGLSYFVYVNCLLFLIGLYIVYKSLLLGEFVYVLVGGVMLYIELNIGYMYQLGLNFLSDGYIKVFDVLVDGMIGGEGVVVVLLKKVVDVVKDGDYIYVLLRGIGVNNDGVDKVGFYVFSVKGQVDVV